jgi:hypothetical protein
MAKELPASAVTGTSTTVRRPSRPFVSGPVVLVLIIAALVVIYFYSNLSAFGFKPAASTPGLSEATNTGMPPVFGKPTLTAAQINTILAKVHSPAAGTGQALYDGSLKSGVNDLFALAVFNAQSKYGTLGVAASTKSLADLKDANGTFISYRTWQAGYTDFYARVAKSGEQSPQVVLDYLYISGIINPINVKQQRIDANEPDITLVVSTMRQLEK